MLERIARLIKRREEDGPRVDVGPLGRVDAPMRVADAVIDAPETVNRLPTRDFIGEEPTDLAPEDPNAEEQQWAHERELYEEKDEGSGSAD
jgi:hypothetical protein